MKHVTDLSAEPIDPELRACLENESRRRDITPGDLTSPGPLQKGVYS
jgi:hypothetical protein